LFLARSTSCLVIPSVPSQILIAGRNRRGGSAVAPPVDATPSEGRNIIMMRFHSASLALAVALLALAVVSAVDSASAANFGPFGRFSYFVTMDYYPFP
jgi:hypothetical protein